MVTFIDNKNILLKDFLKEQFDNSVEALCALAFIRQSGVNMLIPFIEKFIERGNSVSIIFANDFGATEAEAIRTLKEVGVKLKYYSNPRTSFHIKSYIFKKSNYGLAIIGSSNLSASGLSSGKEWNVCVKSDEINFVTILQEYEQLWASEYSKDISDQILSKLESQIQSDELKVTLHEEDQYPQPSKLININSSKDNKLNYVITRKPSYHTTWFFQIYKNQLNRRYQRGEFFVVVICDLNSEYERVFAIPYSYLKENVLPYAHLENNDRYLFNVNKSTYVFNWSRNVKMDGRKFLIK
ncbi:MAG TPA: phospholipase D-like domain-containing protein [Melioribacteraceae bacterium]|nr:phospholipase D-like domain-containing protein [Melioribacteraceae bacterium]